MDFVDDLIKDGWLKTPEIINAFRRINRKDFMPEHTKDLAGLNQALPIGYGQTISQPLVVAFMLEQLQPRPGDKILDVGSGSGWTTALLAQIVSDDTKLKGKIMALEIVPELSKFGKENIMKYNFIKKGIVKCVCADGSKGYKDEAPYNKILVSASAVKLPKALKDQLKIGGKIVAPLSTSIWIFTKKTKQRFEEFECPGFVFVPLIEK